jgi:hypothetical protein
MSHDIPLTKDGAMKVMDILEKDAAPMVGYHKPKWMLPTTPALRGTIKAVVTPRLSWDTGTDAERAVPDGTELVDVDANAAYLSAASSVLLAHGPLEHTGNAALSRVQPGYYLIDAHRWPYGGQLGSPLGPAARAGQKVWVAHPVLGLLHELVDEGHWQDATVYDSWTSQTRCRITTWTTILRNARAHFIISGDQDSYEALKFGYSQAIQMLGTPYDAKGTPADQRQKKNMAYRPDWAHAIVAQSCVNIWRRAWNCAQANRGPLSIGDTDRLTFTAEDLEHVIAAPKPPLRIDQTGIGLGTFKVSATYASKLKG